MSKIKQSLQFAAAALALAFLFGCGDKEPAGGTVELRDAKPIAMSAVHPTEEQARKEIAAKIEKDAEQKRQASDRYVESAAVRAAEIEKSKDGLLIGAVALKVATISASPASTRFQNSNGPIIYGTMFNAMDDLLNGLLPPVGPNPEMVSAGADASATAAVRTAAIRWVASNQKIVKERIWVAVRPMLRQDYRLLATMRANEKLISTKYTRRTFEPLGECLLWHDKMMAAGPVVAGGQTTGEHPEAGRCNGLFQQFGIKSGFGQPDESYAARNALWLVRFFARREGDVDEKFAQSFQDLARDYIKTQ